MTRKRRNPRRSQPLAARATIAEASPWDALLNGGDGIDADEHLYRRLTSSRGDNLPEFKHEKMLAVAKYLSRTNSTGHRLLTILSDFILGEGQVFPPQVRMAGEAQPHGAVRRPFGGNEGRGHGWGEVALGAGCVKCGGKRNRNEKGRPDHSGRPFPLSVEPSN